MTENNSSARGPLNGDPRATGSKRISTRKKTGRVSQRRELAVVTLGAVAAITSLSGILAANPPSWASTGTNAQAPITTQATTTHTQSTPARASIVRVSPNTKDASKNAQSDTAQAPDKAAQAASQQAASQQAAGAVSQGS